MAFFSYRSNSPVFLFGQPLPPYNLETPQPCYNASATYQHTMRPHISAKYPGAGIQGTPHLHPSLLTRTPENSAETESACVDGNIYPPPSFAESPFHKGNNGVSLEEGGRRRAEGGLRSRQRPPSYELISVWDHVGLIKALPPSPQEIY